MKILIVEDDEFIAEALTIVLTNQRYAVEVATDGQAGWELVEVFPYDLLMLDVTLPKLDGISLCRRLRSRGHQMPVLLLTGHDSAHDKAIGLDAGADDYLVKPFDEEELVARVRALLRRGSSASAVPILAWGSLQLDPSACEVTYQEQILRLTPKEYALLELFLRNSRRVFSCGMILEHLWSYGETPSEEAVRTQIKGLRQKLKAAGAATDLIETVYGIGYRLKPLEAMTTPVVSPGTRVQTQQQTMEALAGVWERFQPRVSQQLEILSQTATALRKKTLTQELWVSAEQEAHTLAGSLGTFGCAKGSDLARQIEHLLQARQLGQDEAIHLAELVQALRQQTELPPLSTQPALPQNERPLLLIVASDRELAEPLVVEADSQGLRAEVVSSLVAASTVYRSHPAAVLLDLDTTSTDSFSLLAELRKPTPPVPALVLAADDSLKNRLEVARLGGRIFLQKPVPPAQVLEAVQQVLQQVDPAEARVMVVDDDPQLLVTLRRLLEPWGLRVTTLNDPRRFWETLEAASPDLLILDIKMPYLSGVDLCQIVRNDLRWSGLPVVFLTALTDATTVNQVFTAGADDFVSKPIVGPELVTRIINRLERIKLLHHLTEIDPLTRVFNRQKSTQDLDKFLSLARHHSQPLSLAVLDLDHLKQVNDCYGHAAGDGVLRQLGQLLWQSFQGDVVARWGGEEFVVGMYGMTKSDGVQRLVKVLETLNHGDVVALSTPDDSCEFSQLQVTFSAGVAQYPEDGTDLRSLYRSADAALDQAKSAGRNRASTDLSVRVLPAGLLKPQLSPMKG